MKRRQDAFPKIPCAFVGWDNTPRRGSRSIVIRGQTPQKFEAYLADVVNQAERVAGGDRIAFINAWNEWAEGNYLEPDQSFGRSFLDAVRRVVADATGMEHG